MNVEVCIASIGLVHSPEAKKTSLRPHEMILQLGPHDLSILLIEPFFGKMKPTAETPATLRTMRTPASGYRPRLACQKRRYPRLSASSGKQT